MPRAIMINRMRYDVLLGLCKGESVKQQAERLNLAEQTVKARLRALYAALGVSDPYQAIIRAWRVGILRTCPVCRHSRPGATDDQPLFEGDSWERKVFFVDLGGDFPELTEDDLLGGLDHAKLDELKGDCSLNAGQLLYLRLVAAGFSNYQIAEALHVTEHTVKAEMQRLFLRLDASNRVDAVVTGFLKGYVTEEHVLRYRQGK